MTNPRSYIPPAALIPGMIAGTVTRCEFPRIEKVEPSTHMEKEK